VVYERGFATWPCYCLKRRGSENTGPLRALVHLLGPVLCLGAFHHSTYISLSGK